MEESVLLGTKPLVHSIRHFIRDPSGVFSVCHLCECRIVQWRHDSRLLLLLNWFLHIIKRTLHVGLKIWILCSRHRVISSIYLTNRPQFSMVYTLIDHINDVIKCPKVKWNHEPHVTCYVISMVYTLIEHSSRPISARGFSQLLWKSCFLIITLFSSHLDILVFDLSASMLWQLRRSYLYLNLYF